MAAKHTSQRKVIGSVQFAHVGPKNEPEPLDVDELKGLIKVMGNGKTALIHRRLTAESQRSLTAESQRSLLAMPVKEYNIIRKINGLPLVIFSLRIGLEDKPLQCIDIQEGTKPAEKGSRLLYTAACSTPIPNLESPLYFTLRDAEDRELLVVRQPIYAPGWVQLGDASCSHAVQLRLEKSGDGWTANRCAVSVIQTDMTRLQDI
jgi:hypothetical protein